jgi:hypothetical protein
MLTDIFKLVFFLTNQNDIINNFRCFHRHKMYKKEEHRQYLQSLKDTQKEHQPKKQQITYVIPYKEIDFSTGRGSYK